MNNIKFLTPLFVAVALALGIFLGSVLNFSNQPLAMQNDNLREQKLKQLINYIDYEYVDVVNTDSLLDITIRDLLHKLDPHSSYISQADVQQTSENIQGNFEGIGIEFTVVRDSLTVLRVIENGPSERAGLKAGDRIIIINRDTVLGGENGNEGYISLLKGPSGSKVNLQVYRPLIKGIKKITITRGKIPLPSVELSRMLSNKVGIIKINRFAETTFNEFEKALRELQKQGLEQLILDLRDNPGGLLFTANKIADEFLDKEKLIVYTIDRKGEKDYTFASKNGKFQEGKLVVLINENSASASEIVAGALQDNDRATIVGRRSFGKGLVQEEMQLKDGSRVRLTTSRYYTPTGRSIQKPYGNDFEDYQRDSDNRYLNGELFEADSIKVNEDQKFTTPMGKVVYGGGGIVPDVFVPVDTSAIGLLYHFFNISKMDRFAFAWVDSHRKDFVDYDKESFITNYEMDSVMLQTFMRDLGVTDHDNFLDAETMTFLKARLKALVGRNLFGSEVYFAIMSKLDPMVIEAEKVLSLGEEVELQETESKE